MTASGPSLLNIPAYFVVVRIRKEIFCYFFNISSMPVSVHCTALNTLKGNVNSWVSKLVMTWGHTYFSGLILEPPLRKNKISMSDRLNYCVIFIYYVHNLQMWPWTEKYNMAGHMRPRVVDPCIN